MGKRGNGEGTIRKNPDRNRWEARVTVGYTATGKPSRRMVTGRTRDEVVKRMHELRGAVDNGQDPARRDLTVGRFLDSWLDGALPGTVAPATEQQYRDVVRCYLKPSIGQKHLRTLQASDVSVMLRRLSTEGPPNRGTKASKGRPLSPNTCRIARAVLRRALRHAEVEGLVNRNVAALAQGVKVPRREGRAMTTDQARQLLDAVQDDRLSAAYIVALGLGLRVGELLALAWDDVDLEGQHPAVMVRRGITRVRGVGLVRSDTKTHGSVRHLHLPSPVVDELKAHRKRQVQERLVLGPAWPDQPLGADLIFRSDLGTAVDPANFRHAVYRYTRETFTPTDERPTEPGDTWPKIYQWSPHELRHSAASFLVAAGVPLEVVSSTLGHSSIKLTADTYTHIYNAAKANAAEVMASTLWGTK